MWANGRKLPMLTMDEFTERLKSSDRRKTINPRHCNSDMEPKIFESLKRKINTKIEAAGDREQLSYYESAQQAIRESTKDHGRKLKKSFTVGNKPPSKLESFDAPVQASTWVSSIKNMMPRRGVFMVQDLDKYNEAMR